MPSKLEAPAGRDRAGRGREGSPAICGALSPSRDRNLGHPAGENSHTRPANARPGGHLSLTEREQVDLLAQWIEAVDLRLLDATGTDHIERAAWAIAKRVDGPSMCAFVAAPVLAREAGMGRKRLKRAARAMQASGLLVYEPGNGRGIRSIWKPLLPPQRRGGWS